MEKTWQKNEDQFDAYILGQLSADEQKRFLASLKNDESLNKDFQHYMKIVNNARLEGRQQLRDQLNVIHQKKARPVGKVVGLKKKNNYLWAAATSSQDLFAQHYQPYDLKIGLRDSGVEERLYKIDALYASENYKEVIPTSQQYLEAYPQENKIRMALAISLFEVGEVDKAMTELNIIKDSKDPFLKDQVAWYQALFNIQKGTKDTALNLLQPLSMNKEADHHEAAVELVKALKK